MARQGRRPLGNKLWQHRLGQVWLIALSLGTLIVGLILLVSDVSPAAYATSNTPTPLPTFTPAPLQNNGVSVPTSSKGSLLVPITPALPVANASRTKMTVEAGVGGYARSGTWIPVVVDLENAGDSATGEIAINVAPPQSTNNYNRSSLAYTTLYVQKLDMPAGAKKQVTLNIPFTGDLFNRTLIVAYNGYLGGDSQLRNLATTASLVEVLTNNLLVGVFSSSPDRFATRNDLALNNLLPANTYRQPSSSSGSSSNITHLNFVTLDPARFPSSSQTLDSLNLILLQDYDLSNFNQSQWQAIEAWVNSGGILVLAGGAGAERVLKDLPPQLVPVKPVAPSDLVNLSTSDQAELEKIGGFPLPPLAAGANTLIARLTPNVDSTALFTTTKDSPLEVGLTSGSGAVLMTAFDVSDPRLLSWSGLNNLWIELLRPYLSSPQVFSSDNLYGVNSAYLNGSYGALTNIPGLSLPSLRLLAALALIYIALVGPLSYLVLKILKRRELGWVILPLITILFSGGIYLFALKDKGTDLLTSSVAVVRLPTNLSGPANQPALQMLGIFAPKDNNYTLGLQPGTLIKGTDLPQAYQAPPPQYGQSPGFVFTTPPVAPVGLRISQSDRSQVDLVGMKQWSFRSMLAEGSIKLNGTLESDLAENNGLIEGTITNRTGYALSDVLIMTAYGYQKVGDLGLGQTVKVSFYNRFGQPLNFDTLYHPPVYPGSSSATVNQRTEQRKQQVLQTVRDILPQGITGGNYGYYNPYGSPHTNNNLIIFGWSDQPLLDYTVNEHKVGGNDLSLFISTPQLNLLHSSELLPGINEGTVTKVDSHPAVSSNSSTSSQPYYRGTILQVGEVDVDFNLNQFGQNGALQKAGKQPTELLLQTQNQAYVTSGQPRPLSYQTQIYNWQTGVWDAVQTYVAPPICLAAVPVYQGGVVVTDSPQVLQLNNTSNQPSLLCRQALSSTSGYKPVPTVTSAPPPTTKVVTGAAKTPALTANTPTPVPIRATATPAPTYPAYGYNGQLYSFSLLKDSSAFRLPDHLSQEGKLRVRYTRDNTHTDTLIFLSFSIGYITK